MDLSVDEIKEFRTLMAERAAEKAKALAAAATEAARVASAAQNRAAFHQTGTDIMKIGAAGFAVLMVCAWLWNRIMGNHKPPAIVEQGAAAVAVICAFLCFIGLFTSCEW